MVYPKKIEQLGFRHAEQIMLLQQRQDFLLHSQLTEVNARNCCPNCGKQTKKMGKFKSSSKAGNYASYCRCVESKRISNAKIKGKNNHKNGNAYLAWAFLEAANAAICYYPTIKEYYQRKANKTHRVIALKAVAHKLARASYYIQKDRVEFEMNKAFRNC